MSFIDFARATKKKKAGRCPRAEMTSRRSRGYASPGLEPTGQSQLERDVNVNINDRHVIRHKHDTLYTLQLREQTKCHTKHR